MTLNALHQALILYTWFPLTVLLFFLLLIARFYQKFSGKRTYFRFFMLPMVLFGAAAVRYASIDQIQGDILGDLLSASAGVSLLVLSVTLYRQMLAGVESKPQG